MMYGRVENKHMVINISCCALHNQKRSIFLEHFTYSFCLFWHYPHLKLVTFALDPETSPVNVASIHKEQCWKKQVIGEENAKMWM